jgi:hypothetical protein
MRIAIDINGVLRNTLDKIEKTYQKYMIDSVEGLEQEETFKYEMKLPVTSLSLREHFAFPSDEELFSFLYEEFPMEIFGHSQSAEYSTFNDLNEVYLNMRKEHDFLIVSDEIGKSKPASLFFLSKFGCQFEKIKFFSFNTIDSMWNEVDILVTANPNLIETHPSEKTLVKFETDYNKNINCDHSIKCIKELEAKLNELIQC